MAKSYQTFRKRERETRLREKAARKRERREQIKKMKKESSPGLEGGPLDPEALTGEGSGEAAREDSI